MTITLLPVDITRVVAEITSRVSRPARASASPDPEIEKLRRSLKESGPAAAVCVEWNTDLAMAQGGSFYYHDLSANPRDRSAGNTSTIVQQRRGLSHAQSILRNLPQSVRHALDRCWMASVVHYTGDDLDAVNFALVLSADYCLFLPLSKAEADLQDRIQMPGMFGQDYLRGLVRAAYPDAEAVEAEDICLLPFVPIFDGRGSRHDDLVSLSQRPGSLKRILAGLLPETSLVLDPLQ